MSFLAIVLSLVITGLVVGGLGRLAVPGPNPMGIGTTMLIGIAGAFVGSLVGALLGNLWVLNLVLEVAAAAGLVALVSRRTTGRRLPH